MGGVHRCEACRLPHRWCVCAARETVAVPLAIDVMMHRRERFRPSSSGLVVARVMEGVRLHVWERERQWTAGALRRPGRELWVLHPHGEAMPSAPAPESVQVVLIDGVWSEAAVIAREALGWGRVVSLPMSGESRYWLRAQQEGGRFSTAEAMIHLLRFFGFDAAGETLRRQFELHVYANLRARGLKERAEEFLRGSPAAEAFPGLLARLNERRPLAAPGPDRRVDSDVPGATMPPASSP